MSFSRSDAFEYRTFALEYLWFTNYDIAQLEEYPQNEKIHAGDRYALPSNYGLWQ
jgi:hypothetical protein